MIATLTSQPECQLVGVTSTALLGFSFLELVIIAFSVGYTCLILAHWMKQSFLLYRSKPKIRQKRRSQLGKL